MTNTYKFNKFRVEPRKWFAEPRIRFVALMIYYLGILLGLIALYGQGDFTTPPFVYQSF
jgi:hypothetical protein